MCAATAGYRGRKVLVLDHANKLGKKILMSGGGRCNFTNFNIEPANYLSDNAHFCKSALSRYRSSDFIELVERHGLAYHEKAKGQLFCDNKSQDILDILLQECEWAGAELKTHCTIEGIEKHDDGFRLTTSIGKLACQSLVVATGGLSIPTLGASGKGYDIAKQFGLACTPLQASLVPYTLGGDQLSFVQALSGVSLDVRIHCQQQHFDDALLFTHRGLSGPAVLQITNYWSPGDSIRINFCPQLNLAETLLQQKQQGVKQELKNVLAQYFPKRFAQAWLERCMPSKALHQCSDKELSTVAKHFTEWVIIPPGTEGYRTAEVTRGGVSTDEVSSKTFEAKQVPGLYFIGEVLDVTGWLGGFNFQWAWASGYCAGQVI